MFEAFSGLAIKVNYMAKFSKMKLKLTAKGLVMEGFLSGFLRACIGIALIIFSIGLGFGGENIVELARLFMGGSS